MQKISTFLWFDNQAEEAAKFYTSIFKNSKISKVARYPEGTRAPAGQVMTVAFTLDGVEFTALNGGPHFKFSEAISLVVSTETQAETDELWDKLLSGGGQPSQCGWLKDKYGLSWQITPKILTELVSDKDAAKAQRVFQAMMQMVKIDIQALKDAAAAT